MSVSLSLCLLSARLGLLKNYERIFVKFFEGWSVVLDQNVRLWWLSGTRSDAAFILQDHCHVEDVLSDIQ